MSLYKYERDQLYCAFHHNLKYNPQYYPGKEDHYMSMWDYSIRYPLYPPTASGFGFNFNQASPAPKKVNPMPAKSYIIIGTSGAAAHPVAHYNLSAAESEGNRLSKKTPGEEFTIYQTVKSYKVEQPSPVVKTFV